MNDPSLRVSDADREHTVVSLREHLLAGRLTLDEFSERVEATLQATVSGELARVQHDLPASGAQISRRKPTRFTAALFGHVARRGRLRLRGWTAAASVFGDLDLDLRDAAIDQPRTAATIMLVCGNADVYLPEGINIEVSGLTIFGHLRERGRDTASPDAPCVRIRAIGCCSTVDVWRVPNDVHGSYSDIIRVAKERERQQLEG
jgi:Domain of unknown function (DUF1707)